MTNDTLAFDVRPAAHASWRAELARALLRPVFLLSIAYAVAMCFERAVEVEYYKPYRLIGVALIMMVLLRGRIRVDGFAKLAAFFILIGFLVALLHVNITHAEYRGAIVAGALWTFNLATYVAIASALRTRTEVILVAVAHALGMLVAAWNIAAGGVDDPLLARQYGDFSNPANACVGMLFAAIVLIATSHARRKARSAIGGPLRTVGLLAVVLFLLYTASRTGSRAGAGLLVVGLMVFFWVHSRKMSLLIGLLAGLFLAGASLVSSDYWRETGSDLSESNILALRVEKKGLDTTRLYLWKSGLDAFADTYGVGVGMAMYQTVHREYYAPYAGNGGDARWGDKDLSLHNDYVRALVEFGVLGFVVFLLMIRRLVRDARAIDDPAVRSIALAILAGLAINGLSHNGLSYYSVWFYFGLMSAWLAAEHREARAARQAAAPGGRR